MDKNYLSWERENLMTCVQLFPTGTQMKFREAEAPGKVNEFLRSSLTLERDSLQSGAD